ncbi:hypothetical protein C1H46_000863 [Malus baccata]|uniref:Uncharacterized protein n=1 Tax=Malus baccata TaxID=106549 RepID=A0A540NR83_MALBA|nr:hypothetical protein C1H46_000863 [Malus baccata]
MFSIEFVCRVPALLPARVFPTPPSSPCCLPFPAVSLRDFPGCWLLSLGCRLSLAYGCAQVVSEEVMIGGGRRIGWLDASQIGGGESSGCFSEFLLFLGFTVVELTFYYFFIFRPFFVCLYV